MRGCSSTSVSLVNAEVDSMGEVVEVSSRTSPRRVEIENVQIELSQEYNVREEKKRELEFLENGGNPLDFKHGNAASVSVQSTSSTDQHPNLFLTSSEAKVSFAFAVSPCGDSLESSDRLGPPHCEPSSADNLMLFDAGHELSKGDRVSLHPNKSHIVPSQQSIQTDESNKTMEPEDSGAFGLPKKAYKRLYRSRRNRDGIRSSSTGANPTCGGYGSSLPSCHVHTEVKELAASSKNQHMPLNCNSEPASPVHGIHLKAVLPDGQRVELDGAKSIELNEDLIKGVLVDASSDNIASENLLENQHNQQLLSGSAVTPTQVDSYQPEAVYPMQEMTSSVIDLQPSVIFVSQFSSCPMNGFSCIEGDLLVQNAHESTPHTINALDSDLSCTENNTIIDGKKFSKMRNIDCNGNMKNKKLLSDGTPAMEGNELLKEKKKIEGVITVSSTLLNEETDSACPSLQKNGFTLHSQKHLNQSGCTLRNEAIKEMETGDETGLESGRRPSALLDDNWGHEKENSCNIKHLNSTGISMSKLSDVASLTRVSSVSPEAQISYGPNSILGNGIDEDSILKEAQIIETKRKRIMELSTATSPVEFGRKSQWDYVLEEMAWLANDFVQERIWKIAAAAQICCRATFQSQLRKQENNFDMVAKKVAHTLSKAVIGFWHSIKESSIEQEQQNLNGGELAVVAYAVSFLKYNKSNVLQSQVETAVPLTIDRTSGIGIQDRSWDDNLTEENLFYTVPLGAMETYRKSIEFHETQFERIGNIMQEEAETSECDVTAEIVYDEGEDEIAAYELPVFEGGDKSFRIGQKKRKQLTHAYGARACELGSSISSMQYADIKVVTQQSALPLKRPGSSLNVSIPTKRVRTASRRVISPFSVGQSGCMVGPNKADVSSGDTGSFQDDQSTLHGGPLGPNSLESEFVGEFKKHSPFDSPEVSTKFKKKPKYMNAYKQRWQFDSSYQNEQRGHWKKGTDVYQLESNGSDGLLGQPIMKKLKTRQSHANSYDNNITPIGTAVTSPVASQMSNMFHPNKIVKVLGGLDHDRSRKPKVLKIPAGQPSSGSPWSLFEDQALVVLVHDLGPNWELISDAINDTLHFKHIFRKPKDCKERHHVLMDGTSSDAADSAEDSGSSQPYYSTLPGIPKGSARQLFQRLQEPMDEDTLNSHFDKIIIHGQKQHNRKTQDPRQLQQPHTSHTIALAQVCPNNLNGGLVLTPLDFYEATLAGPDTHSLGYQGPNTSLLTNPNQGTASPILPASGASSAFQGSSPMIVNNIFPSSPGSFNAASRDGIYGTPKSASLSTDDQLRMQQYGQIISGRNISQHNMAAPGALTGTGRGVRILPGGNGMDMVGGVNRTMPAARPGLQGIVSSSMLNSGSTVSPVMVSTNMHSGVGSGSSLLRPREASHMIRPGIGQDSHRQMMLTDHQMQVSPGNSQGMPLFGGLSSLLPNQTASPPMQSYPMNHQQSHPASPQHPQVLSPRHPHFQGPATHMHNPQQRAYVMHLAKERQLKQQFLQQQPQQQQFGVSNTLTPHVQSQSQLPISSPMQNSSPVQPQTCSPPVSLSPLTPVSAMNSASQYQQKHHSPTELSEHNSQTGGSGLTNQTGRQRHRQQQQQFSQASRQHPLQRQQSLSQEQPMVLNGAGRGNPTMNQTIPMNPSPNGVSTNPGNQCLEKGETAAPLIQSRGLYTGSTQNAVQPTRQYISSQSSNKSLFPQKAYSSQTSSSSKHHQRTSHPDAGSHGHASSVAHAGLSAVQQSVPSLPVAGAKHQQSLPHGKLGNQTQSITHRAVRPTGTINSDTSNKLQARESDTSKHPTRRSSEMDTMTNLDSNDLGSELNLSSMPSIITSSSEPLLLAGQGLGQRPTPASLPPIRHDVNVHWQQSLHPQQSQQLVPPHQQTSTQQQQPLLPLHSQQQAKLLQAGNGNLYGRPSDTRI